MLELNCVLRSSGFYQNHCRFVGLGCRLLCSMLVSFVMWQSQISLCVMLISFSGILVCVALE